ncbi:NHLP family bacteriocin export ABC transporter peptidase/permease/ATPase subunit [Coleofasciculus chthonoplastes]|uniref:NHLP family bacteriocin export ABC transporter peptidase/permease/ATPase subunit n=1 Tax=Coleofasciculus chthonoplastes TaxID=64178 RepID=UPI0032FEFBA5
MIKLKLSPLFKRKASSRVKTPTLLQMEAVECGAAALGIMLGYYGKIVPLAELRRECGVSRDGSKASNMLKAARNYGLKAKGFKKQLDSLLELTPPYIVFWNFNHFLVVEGFVKGRVYLNDPGTGPRSVSFQEFDEAYTGVVLVMEPDEGFQKGGRKPSIVNALRDRLVGSIPVLTYCVIAGFLLVLPQLAIPIFSKIFVDQILVEGMSDWLRPLLLGMGLTALLRGLLKWLQLQFLRRMKIKLGVEMSGKFLWHILHLPVSFYAQRFAGEISDRVSLNDEVADVISGRLTATIIDLVMAVIYVLVMFFYNIPLTLIGVMFAAINIFTLQLVSRQRKDANMQLTQAHGKVAGVSISGLQSMETLKASGLESDFFSKWAGYYAQAINVQKDLGVTNQTLGVLPSFLSAVADVMILLVGGLQVIEGNLSIGDLVAFQSLLQSFLDPVNNLVNFGSTLQELEGDLNRLDDVLQNPTEEKGRWGDEGQAGQDSDGYAHPDSASPTSLLTSPRLEGYVELKNITFGYSRVAEPLIQNFNLSLQPGQRVALVGGSGSGKSTLAKLVCGLYEPWQGEICFDGQPRAQIPRHILTNSVAMVEQDIFLFAGTIRDNLTLWDSTIPTSKIIQACEDAAIDDVIFSISGGLESHLAEGATNLSGGQRQRLEIARALVNNPSILVMDEATSALDTESEEIIDQNLRRRGCSCIIVAHRLSTIRDCDEIVVFEQGKVVQRGTHETLSQQSGVYARLLKSEGERGEQGELGL